MPQITNNKPLSEQHVIVLINYLRRHHVMTFKEFERRVGKLTILVSTPMEGDRDWLPEWEGLDVIVQKNTTITLTRSSGFDEKNYIHFPWDTISKLRRLKPDIVFSYEMGMRTFFCGLFRLFNRNVPLVMIGNMSDHIEGERGWIRRIFRQLIRRMVDGCTYNGPSCKKYLSGLGVDDSDLFYFPYCFDQEKTFQGEKQFSQPGVRTLLYCGALSERKWILPFVKMLGEYCDEHLNESIKLIIAGDGPLRGELLSQSFKNLIFDWRGNCEKDGLRKCYEESDVFVFPTMGDEWGLVPVEAWSSGVPVLGSNFAQSVESVGLEGENGWFFDGGDEATIRKKVEIALSTSHSRLHEMSKISREEISKFTPQFSADLLCQTMTGMPQPGNHHSSSIQIKNTPEKSTTSSISGVADTTKHSISNSVSHLPPATLSLDLDNKWSYLKSHNNPAWESFPSYLSDVVPRILSTLDELELKITFFVVGQDAVIPENQDAIRMLADHGHEIANHSFHHEQSLPAYTPEQLENEFEMAENAIENVVGQKLVGFRGPGFSLSDQTLKLLQRRGYLYDCTTFPTYLGPLARAFYFMSGSFNRKQRRERQALFGKFMDGFAPNYPYLWQMDDRRLLEIPVSTMPGFKTPVHATYLHYLSSFSPAAASSYWSMALWLYEFNRVSPSFLLHPLDFIGGDDEPDLRFFPGMKLESQYKLARLVKYLEMLKEKYQVIPMKDYAKLALSGDLESRSVMLARTGLS